MITVDEARQNIIDYYKRYKLEENQKIIEKRLSKARKKANTSFQ